MHCHRNSVRARLVERAQDWRWSSTRAHLRGRDDGLTALAPIRERFPRFSDLLAAEPDAEMLARLRAAESIGRPLGGDRFLARIERATKRRLKPGKRGPKPAARITVTVHLIDLAAEPKPSESKPSEPKPSEPKPAAGGKPD